MTASFQAYDFLSDAEMTIDFVKHQLGEAKQRIISSHNNLEQTQQALAAANGTVANLRRLNGTLEEQFTHLKNVHVGFDGFFRNMTGNLETANDRNDALEEVIDDRNDEIHKQGNELREQTELVRLLNEQLAGLHEHQVQQYLLSGARGQQDNNLLSSSVSSNIANPTLACNNALIMNQRLRATIVYLRTSLSEQKKKLKAATKQVDELQLERDEIAYEFQELDEISKADQPSDFLLHLFPTVPMDTLSKVAAVLNSKDRELAAVKLALEQEKNFRAKAEEELATAMDGTC